MKTCITGIFFITYFPYNQVMFLEQNSSEGLVVPLMKELKFLLENFVYFTIEFLLYFCHRSEMQHQPHYYTELG